VGKKPRKEAEKKTGKEARADHLSKVGRGKGGGGSEMRKKVSRFHERCS